MAKVELKKPIVAEISENVKDAQSVVLVDYRGLTVEQDTQLRRQLREAGITYKVYKNTMMNFAFKGTDFESLAPHLEGPSAIAISKDDATAPARVLAKFAKTTPALELKGGVVEGVYYDAKGILGISSIPSKEELLSKLLGSIQSPIANFARVMNQLAEKGGAGACEAPAEAKAEEAPAEEAKAEEAPAEEVKAEEAPAEEAKAEEVPAEEVKAEEAKEEAPAEEAKAEE
jgi:large subunit ribosomal protein L10